MQRHESAERVANKGDAARVEQRQDERWIGAAVRAASAGSAFALTNGDLLAPILLHAVAGALAAAAPLSPDPDDVQDPDRAVVTVGAAP